MNNEDPCFHVTLNKDGSIASCELVPTAGADGRYHRYVYARDAAAACSETLAWYTNYREKRNARSRAFREKRKAEGKCIEGNCEKAPRPGQGRCEEHYQKCKENNKTYQKRKAGKLPPIKRNDPETVRANARKHSTKHYYMTKRRAQHSTYVECLMMVKQLPFDDYKAWLVARIEDTSTIDLVDDSIKTETTPTETLAQKLATAGH